MPSDLYEAAAIDGASKWRRFRSITVPMISPAIFFQVIILTIAVAADVRQGVSCCSAIPAAPPTPATRRCSTRMYLFQQAFQSLRMGYASALAWLLFVIIMIITVIQVKVGNRFVYYEGGRSEMTVIDAPTGRAALAEPLDAGRDPTCGRRTSGHRPDRCRCRYVVVLSVLAVIFLYPFVWLLSASFKTRAQRLRQQADPDPGHPRNYVRGLARRTAADVAGQQRPGRRARRRHRHGCPAPWWPSVSPTSGSGPRTVCSDWCWRR